MPNPDLLLLADFQLAEEIENPIESIDSLLSVAQTAFNIGAHELDGELSSDIEYECVVRLVGENESQQLNAEFRNKDKPTNVLSFTYDDLENYIGDIVICLPVVEREALEQNKPFSHHLQHMIVHGILHLLGYDHEQDDEAEQMEALEQAILAQFGIDNPYEPH